MYTMMRLASRCMSRFGCGRSAGSCGWGAGPGRMGGFWLPMMAMGLGMLIFWVLVLGGALWLVASLTQLGH